MHAFVSRPGGCSAARTFPKLACPEDTFPGPEYLPPPCLGQRGLSGPWAGASHHPDPAGASPWCWSQFLAHRGTRGAFSTSILERLRFSHWATPEPPGSLAVSLSGMARADLTPRSPRDSGGFLVLSHFCIQFPLSVGVHRGRRLTPPLPCGLTFNF